MSPLLHLVLTVVLCTALAGWLATSRWPWRAPWVGIVCCQLVLATWVLSVLGALLAAALLPYDPDIPSAVGRLADAWLTGAPTRLSTVHGLLLAGFAAAKVGVLLALGAAVVNAARMRRRQRDLLALLGRRMSATDDVTLLDHALPVAYCLPGRRPTVVVSSGAVGSLSVSELGAVLAHERAHASARHDLVLLPFNALRRWAGRLALVRRLTDAVALLVEMHADDLARRRVSTGSLAGALRRFRAAGSAPPAGTLGIGGSAVDLRLARIAGGTRRMPRPVRWSVLLSGAVLIATPLSFLGYPG